MISTFIIYYVETNLICFLFVAFVLYSYIRESHGLTESKWFLATLFTVQIYCIADIFAALFKNQTFPGARIILLSANTIYIAIPAFLVIFWALYVKEHFRVYYKPGKLVQYLDKILLAAAIILCIISLSAPLTHSSFYLDEANGYHRRVVAYIVPAFSYLFLIYETVKLQRLRKETDSLQVKHDANILSLFAIPCIFFSGVQVVLYGTTLSQVGFTMALMIIYLGRQSLKISRDELTGLNNRREYEYAIDRLTRSNGTAMIVMVDVNGFKLINDTYGHLEGDYALKEVAKILRASCSHRKELGSVALYRYGGDEFSMVSTETNLEASKSLLLKAIDEETEKWNAQSHKPYSLRLSVGVACGDYSGKNIYKLIDEADKKMYQAKK